MERDRDVYYRKWFNLRIDGKDIRAQCIDIEYEGDLGPLFLMKAKWGKKFWMTRREIRNNVIN